MAVGDFEYIPRKPEETVLYRAIAEHLETFLARQQERERPVPRFVEKEFRTYLTCGIAEHGFLRLHCDKCGHDRILPFSCKKRSWCPSCGGRRMADTAAHLVERVSRRLLSANGCSRSRSSSVIAWPTIRNSWQRF